MFFGRQHCQKSCYLTQLANIQPDVAQHNDPFILVMESGVSMNYASSEVLTKGSKYVWPSTYILKSASAISDAFISSSMRGMIYFFLPFMTCSWAMWNSARNHPALIEFLQKRKRKLAWFQQIIQFSQSFNAHGTFALFVGL